MAPPALALYDRVEDVAASVWKRALQETSTNVAFLTQEWQRAWWDSFGRRRAYVVVVERPGRSAAIAPFFCDGGMAFLIGSGGSDYLDVLGDPDGGTLALMLDAVLEREPDLIGFRFYHLPETSPTTQTLPAAADALGLSLFEEASMSAPYMDLRGEAGRLAVRKKSLVRHENGLNRDGELRVRHLTDNVEILRYLPLLFEQHRKRWSGSDSPSLFADSRQRDFYCRICRMAGNHWLRFTVVELDGDPVAMHLGSHHQGRYLWYKPTYDVRIAKRSPGEVLLRHLILQAMSEGAHTFDFGLGDEAFKDRFATGRATVRDWGLYRPSALRRHP